MLYYQKEKCEGYNFCKCHFELNYALYLILYTEFLFCFIKSQVVFSFLILRIYYKLTQQSVEYKKAGGYKSAETLQFIFLSVQFNSIFLMYSQL